MSIRKDIKNIIDRELLNENKYPTMESQASDRLHGIMVKMFMELAILKKDYRGEYIEDNIGELYDNLLKSYTDFDISK